MHLQCYKISADLLTKKILRGNTEIKNLPQTDVTYEWFWYGHTLRVMDITDIDNYLLYHANMILPAIDVPSKIEEHWQIYRSSLHFTFDVNGQK